jgi:antitoxin
MKYPYYVEYTDFGSPILQLPDEVDLVTVFLASDVQGRMSKNFFLEEINRVLQGEIPSSEIGGNMCALEIKKDFTTVIDTLSGNENDPKDRCVIETEELRDLILVWLQLRRVDSKQRDTEAIRRVSTSITDQSLVGHELSTDASTHA